MSPTPIPLGARLPLADYSSLAAQQQRFFDEMTSTVVPWAGASSFLTQDGEGRFIGPFNPALLHPELGKSFLELQYVEANRSIPTARTREVISLTVGSVWQANYELYAHSAVAGHAGLPEDVVISSVAGETPDGLQPEELIAHRAARQLTAERRIDDSLYGVAEEGFGRHGVLDIVILVGIYQTVCGLLNAFERSPLAARSAARAVRRSAMVADNPHVRVPEGGVAVSMTLAAVAESPDIASAPHPALCLRHSAERWVVQWHANLIALLTDSLKRSIACQ